MRNLVALRVLLLVVLVGALAACNKSTLRSPKGLGQSKVVEKTPKNRPAWVGTSYKEKGDSIYFSGQVDGVPDRALGMRQAKADAMQNLLESIRVRARSEFSEAVTGNNTATGETGRYVDSLVAWTTDSIDVSGVIPVEEYTETVKTRTYSGHDTAYNCHVWLRLPKEDYFTARQAALDRAATEATGEEAEELARNAKERLEQGP